MLTRRGALDATFKRILAFLKYRPRFGGVLLSYPNQIMYPQLTRVATALALLLLLCTCDHAANDDGTNVLVFSKTEQFRHESIPAGQAMLRQLGADKGFNVTVTEDATDFSNGNLAKYHAVVFLSTTGDVLNDEQQEAFERFIQAGGGYVGIHAATDTEYEWPWYGKLAGAYFTSHPSEQQPALFSVLDHDHPATQGMADTFTLTDEIYNFRNISAATTKLISVDETTYEGGTNPDFHPISWYQEFDGGRSFYTALGHREDVINNPLFIDHVYGGLTYVLGGADPQPLDYNKARPEANRFNKVVLADNLNEPMELALLDDDRVLFIQRKGEVMLFNTATEEMEQIAQIPVSLEYTRLDGSTDRAEDGLLGLIADPNFADNQHVYMYYSPPGKSVNRLSRFTMDGDELPLDSEVTVLEVTTQRRQCCHTGGSMAWDNDGNLYLSTGDNTNPFASNGFSPSDERPGRSPWDAQGSSANTNDLRGKVLRIHPEADGSYTIPAGNLFPAGTDKTRPEIYTMGHRNPYRISLDNRRGYLFWGDVGPDARENNPNRGPRGHDEIGRARGPGNFGWPHFVGDNKAYHRFDFATGTPGEAWDAAAPLNKSPNNTGLEQLPPAQEALIWYPYANSEEFPLMGTGGRNAMAGPVYYSADFPDAERALPAYYDGKLLAYEWMRGFIMAVELDENGDYKGMERFLPQYNFVNPMDMVFHRNGDLYLLEYGSGWFAQNANSSLSKIEYNGGNRPPEVAAFASTAGGAVPLTVDLDASGTRDYDGDEVKYTWTVTSEDGFEQTLTGAKESLTLTEPGVYTAQLIADDGKGGTSSETVTISAGNELPVVALDITEGNSSFFVAGQPITYNVNVSDAEDGELGNGIDPFRVAFNVDYLAEGYDKTIIAAGHRRADDVSLASRGETLIGESDCKSCHKANGKSVGPSYLEVARRYEDDKNALTYLSGKIINGGGGVWGENVMAAHPDLDEKDAREMVRYIMSLGEQEKNRLPLKGTYLAALPEGDEGKGVFILRAAYKDKGARKLPALSSESTVVLRNATMGAHAFDEVKGAQELTFDGRDLLLPGEVGAYGKFNQISLRNVRSINFFAMAPIPMVGAQGGTISLHLDAPDGPLLGTSPLLEATPETPGPTTPPTVLTVPVVLPTDADPGQKHDVYAVFNPPGDKAGPIMVVVGMMVDLSSGQPTK